MYSIMNKYILLVVIFFMSSCAETGVSDEEIAAQQRNDYTGAKLFMDMVDNGGSLSLTLSVGNFASIDNMSLDLKFNYNNLSISGFENGDFTSLDYANSYNLGLEDSLASFAMTDVSGSGTLFTVNLSGTGFEGTTIYIDLERFDISANGKSKYFYCSASGYENNVACINSENYWRLNTEELASIVGLSGKRRFVFWDMYNANLKPLYEYWKKYDVNIIFI